MVGEIQIPGKVCRNIHARIETQTKSPRILIQIWDELFELFGKHPDWQDGRLKHRSHYATIKGPETPEFLGALSNYSQERTTRLGRFLYYRQTIIK